MKNTKNIVLDTIIAEAKEKLAIENKELAELGLPQKRSVIVEVPNELLVVDHRYQRDLNESKRNNMVINYNPDLEDIKVGNYRSNERVIAMIEGQHEIAMRKAIGFPTTKIILFFDLTIEEEADLFVKLNSNKTRVNSTDKFKADTISKKPYTEVINRVVSKYECTIKDTGTRKVHRNIGSIQILVRIYNKYGEDGLDFTLKLIEDAGWIDIKGALTEAYLTIGFAAYPYCKDGAYKARTKYATLLTFMRSLEAPDAFLGAAKKAFPTMTGKHGEGSIKAFVCDLLEDKD